MSTTLQRQSRLFALAAITLAVVLIRPLASRDAAQAQSEPPSTTELDGLTLHVSGAWVGRSAQPSLAIEISNESDRDISLNLGMVVGMNHCMYPTAIKVIITDASGKTRTYRIPDMRLAGRADDYLVPLRRGGSYRLGLALSDLRADSFDFPAPSPASGKCQAVVELESGPRRCLNSGTEGMRVVDLWTGKLLSESTEIEIPGRKPLIFK
ncbi:MAG TPA: hypothetical protein VM510_17525 [Caulifigura sp.]|jgi:hypothetical protein|nr:hypothetical protein [Caulifigura sp.]